MAFSLNPHSALVCSHDNTSHYLLYPFLQQCFAEIEELEQAEALVGQQVNKKFNGTFYLGTVKTYDAERYVRCFNLLFVVCAWHY